MKYLFLEEIPNKHECKETFKRLHFCLTMRGPMSNSQYVGSQLQIRSQYNSLSASPAYIQLAHPKLAHQLTNSLSHIEHIHRDLIINTALTESGSPVLRGRKIQEEEQYCVMQCEESRDQSEKL